MPEAERLEQEPRFKVWRTVTDDKTRDSHVLANGQVRFVGEPFKVGDAALSEPRDPDGPPEETYNCRCLKEEYTLSDLPKELLPQIEGRLTERQRLLLSGIRVADINDQLADGPTSSDSTSTAAEQKLEKELNTFVLKTEDALALKNKLLAEGVNPALLNEFEKRINDFKVDLKGAQLYPPEKQKKVFEVLTKELEFLKKKYPNLFQKGELIIFPIDPSKRKGVNGGVLRGDLSKAALITVVADVSDAFLETSKDEADRLKKNEFGFSPGNVSAREIEQIEKKAKKLGLTEEEREELIRETLHGYLARHEIAHAKVSSTLPDLLDKFIDKKGKDWFKRNVSLRAGGQEPTEAMAESMAWYTSPFYDGSLPKDLEKILEDILQGRIQ